MVCQYVGDRRNEGGSLGRKACDRVANCKLIVVVLIEGIDIGGGKLASWHLFREKNIEFVECAVFGFWEAEVGPDENYPRASTPHKAVGAVSLSGLKSENRKVNAPSVTSQIPCLRVHHVVLKSSTDNTSDVGNIASKTDSFLSQSSGANFGGKGPAYRDLISTCGLVVCVEKLTELTS